MKQMRYILSILLVCLSAQVMWAQYNPIDFFPNEKGDYIIKKTFDSSDNLIATSTYIIQNSYDYQNENNLNMTFSTEDASGDIIDSGDISLTYESGNFYMRMANNMFYPDITKFLSIALDLPASFLDYPNTDGMDSPFEDGIFMNDPATIVVSTNERRAGNVVISVGERILEKGETVATPAGKFEASKIVYDVEVRDNDTMQIDTYKGIEWYSPGVGIVITQIFDNSDNMVNYTVVTEIGNDD